MIVFFTPRDDCFFTLADGMGACFLNLAIGLSASRDNCFFPLADGAEAFFFSLATVLAALGKDFFFTLADGLRGCFFGIVGELAAFLSGFFFNMFLPETSGSGFNQSVLLLHQLFDFLEIFFSFRHGNILV